jgi:tetratricopeptide (TPR) repeat protein
MKKLFLFALAALLPQVAFAQPQPAPGASAPASPPAAADDATTRARRLFDAGQSSYKIGDFKSAIQAFEQAYAIDPRPALLFSIGQAHRRQYFVDNRAGHVAVAIQNFREYLAKVESGGRRADAVLALNELQPLALTLEIEGRLQPLEDEAPETRLVLSTPAEGATVSIDGGAAKPLPMSVVLPAGSHALRVEAPGYVAVTREINVVEGGVTALDLVLEGLPAQVAIEGPSGATVSVDGKVEATLPLAAPLPVSAGERRIRVAMNGHLEFAQTVDLGRGQPVSLAADLAWTDQRKAALGLLLGGGALFVGGAALGGVALARHLDASSIKDDIDAGQVICRTDVCQPLDDYNGAVQARDDLGLAGVLLGSAALAATGGLLLFLFDPPGQERAAPTKVDAPEAAPTLEVSVGPFSQVRVRF